MPPTSSLIDSLAQVRRTVRLLAIASGVGLALSAAIGLLIGVVLIDWGLGLETLPRLLLMLAALGALIYVVWNQLAVPAMARVNLGDVAGRVEKTFPQFDDRLRSAVNFVQGRIPGSSVMQQRVASEAGAIAQRVDFTRVIVHRPLYWASVTAIGSMLLLAGLLTWGGKSGWLSIAANRLLLGNQPWPKSVEIALDPGLPTRVAVGQRIPIKMHLVKGDKESRRATIYYRYDNGPWQQEIMTRQDGAYSALLDARLEQGHKDAALQVRIESGDDEKQPATIAVVPRLEIARVAAVVTPPPYVQPANTSEVNLSERAAAMAFGSQVELRVQFNKALAPDAAVEMQPVRDAVQKVPAVQWSRAGSDVAVARFQAANSLRFTLKATDTDGFHNAAGEEFELLVREDQPPTVQIEEPRRGEDRTPDAAFDVKAVAEDDYGVVGAQLVADRVSGQTAPTTEPSAARPNHWVIDLVKGTNVGDNASWSATDSTPERKRYRLGYHWELAQLKDAGLKPGDVVEFYVQVKDNFLLDGKEHPWVPSGKLRFTIISHEDWEKQAQAVAEQIQRQINAERMTQSREKAESDTLKEGLDRNKKFDEADKAQATRMANDQASTQSQTIQLGERLENLVQKMNENKSPDGGLKQVAAQVAKELKQTADNSMRDAKQNLDAANDHPPDPRAKPEQQEKDARNRAGNLSKASQAQQNAADELAKAMDKLGQMGGLSEAIEKIQKIRDKQEEIEKQFQKDNKDNIGKKPDELAKEDQDRNKKQSDQQNDLAKQLDTALNNMDQKADKMSKSDPSSSQAMKQAAQMGKQSGLSSKQQQAAQDMQQNQQAQAQDNQRQVELGLDQILNKLKEAERKQLEELARQLAQMQQLIAELIQRQSGHNIDNLLLQGGPDRLAKLDLKERDSLIELSGRDAKNLAAPPPITGLSASQEQTERNARDYAHQAETLDDPAPAAKLAQAAGLMERAIVHLRDNKLPDAYQPPQVDALATLLEAKKLVDEAAKKVQDKLDEKDAETIKQAYVKLLEEQKKIGADLLRIDKTPKDGGGDLPRDVSVRLAQLPTDQGKLIESARKIGDQLKQLDSVVYDWANRDIIKSMGETKDGLAKPDTGKPTQVAERHTEEELEAMIDSLVEKINKSKFDQRGGGGGGGQGQAKAKLPTEAELRLLRHNQEAINARTIEQDKQAEKDKSELLSLGGRQQDLRNLLDQLIQKASNGQQKLGPPPDPNEQLPEEASKDDIDNQEIQDDLLHDRVGDKTVDKGIRATGNRMARSGTRLALNNDPGKVTQEIQKRITIDLDDLIKMAQQQQANSQSKPGQGKGQKMGQPQPKPGGGQQQVASGSQKPKQGGTQAATDSQLSRGSDPQADLSGNIKEAMEEWGRITQRDRQAVQEGAGEQVIGKYKKFVEDYYRSLAEQATKR